MANSLIAESRSCTLSPDRMSKGIGFGRSGGGEGNKYSGNYEFSFVTIIIDKSITQS